jgi:hypothetical protein
MTREVPFGGVMIDEAEVSVQITLNPDLIYIHIIGRYVSTVCYVFYCQPIFGCVCRLR